MSEQVEVKSLVGLANQKGAVSREAPDVKTRSASSQATRRGGFDGFLKTFLGKDKPGRAGQAAAKSGAGAAGTSLTASLSRHNASKSGGGKGSSAAAGLSREEKQSLRRAMEKTVPAEASSDEAAPADETAAADAAVPYEEILAEQLPEELLVALTITPEIAAAAAEAARLLWGIVYGGGGEADAAAAGLGGEAAVTDDAVAALAGLLDAMKQASGEGAEKALAGLGGSTIDAEALLQAVGTANASAEMNNAAVLAALEELLDGMPRQALHDALVDTAREMGMAEAGKGEDIFNEIAKALGAEIVSVENGDVPAGSARLLAELNKAAERPPLAALPVGETTEAIEAEITTETETADPAAAEAESGEGDERLVDVYAGEEEPAAVEGETTPEDGVEPLPTSAPKNANAPEAAAIPEAETMADAVGDEVSGKAVAVAEPELDAAMATEEMPEAEMAKTPAAAVSTAADTRVVNNDAKENEVEAAEATREAPVAQGAERQKEAVAAENSGAGFAESDIYGLFEQFLKEKNTANSPEGPINIATPVSPEAAEKLLDEFATWLLSVDNSSQTKALVADRQALARLLETALNSGATTSKPDLAQVFSWARENLEKFLQSGTDMKTVKNPEPAAVPLSGIPANGAGTPGAAATGELAKDSGAQIPFAATPSATATATPAQAPATPAPGNQATVSSMLDQIENIERLADALRMSNRNGVKNLTMQLSPPELGKLTLRVVSRDGVVSAYLRVEKPEAAAQLSGNLAQLRENLKAQGIELGELDIRQHQQQTAADFTGHRHRKDHENAPDAKGTTRDGTMADPEEGEGGETGETTRSRGGGLNLFA